MPSSPPRIAIIGGGPAGLAVGVLLHKRNIPFTIFELRQKPTDEELSKPSGMLDLHKESGISAIKECGLYDEFLTLTGECTEAAKVADKHCNILWTDEGELSERPEISRHALTKLLLSYVPVDEIKWGHKLISATRSTTLEHTEIHLDFGPNGKHSFDLVIGADGTWSRVRNLLTDVKPHYSGMQFITLTIREITTKYPHLAELVGLGGFTALGDRHGVMSQRGPQDSARIYIFLTREDESFATSAGIAGQSALEAKELLLGDQTLLKTWAQPIKELVAVACDEEAADNPGTAVDVRPLYILPPGPSWEHQLGATLIGDASHVMSPFAGEGVNLAMWDSLLLAHAIITAYEATGNNTTAFQHKLDPLIKEFEVDMAARAKEKAEESLSNGKMMFGEDGAQAFAEFFRSAFAEFGMGPEEAPGA